MSIVLRAIGLDQPWATLFLLMDPDEKVFETRSFYTHIRGTVFIHANQSRNPHVREALGNPFFQERLAAHGLNVTDLPYGALIGTVNLIACTRIGSLPAPGPREAAFGNWSPERFAWQRAPATRIFSRAIPFKGKQGFFNVPYAAVARELLGSASEAPQEVAR